MLSNHPYPCLLVENHSKTVVCQLSSFMQKAWMNGRMSEAFGCKKTLITSKLYYQPVLALRITSYAFGVHQSGRTIGGYFIDEMY